MEDQPPQRPRDLDNPRVAEELREVGAHGLRGGRAGAAQVDEQHGSARARAVLIRRPAPNSLMAAFVYISPLLLRLNSG